MKEPCNEILDADQASDLLRVSKTTLYSLSKRGKLPGRRIGREWRFVRSNLLDWISQNTYNSRPCWEIKNCPTEERNHCIVYTDAANREPELSVS